MTRDHKDRRRFSRQASAKFTGITVNEPQDTVNVDEPFIIDARITNLGSESILQSFTIKLHITGAQL
ncbi:MAG: hypothetical protein IPL67_19355 [Ignavibacteria bacterium]|nr:hypothetical protein [Ignavibacteria bacterium]